MRSGDRIVYVDMAGERARSGKNKPSGLRGRLARYASGKATASGFGESALDRALADVAFVKQQLAALEGGEPRRTPEWAKEAIRWHRVELRWTICPDADAARTLEDQGINLLRPYGVGTASEASPRKPRLSQNHAITGGPEHERQRTVGYWVALSFEGQIASLSGSSAAAARWDDARSRST